MKPPGLAFLKPSKVPKARVQARAWTVLVVDDDPQVHDVTRLVLSDFTFDDRPLELLHAMSGGEGFDVLQANPDTALILLDVVMETEHAGLDLVARIREELGNAGVRIVLRTGQPGAAPERSIVRKFDINDYKDKTELTAAKMETLLFASLRGYRDIKQLEMTRLGLEAVIEASGNVLSLPSTGMMTNAVLAHLIASLPNVAGAVFVELERGVVGVDPLLVVAAAGGFSGGVGRPASELLSAEVIDLITGCITQGRGHASAERFVGLLPGRRGADRAVYLTSLTALTDIDLHLATLFLRTAGIALENARLQESLDRNHREIAYRLGGAVETRSKETSGHVKRVAQFSHMLALKHGMGEEEAALFRQASPLHDIGKIGIAETILNKPGPLDPAEWTVMKTHTTIGYELLRDSDVEVLTLGARIAIAHHEKWDGSGYPHGLVGEAIDVRARITAIADVFDAVTNRRAHKEPWTAERALELIADGRGRHFDPRLANLFLDAREEVLAIQAREPDPI